MKISIIGIGRVGLPLALAFSDKGFLTYGIDINEDYVNTIKQGKMPFMEDDAEEILKKNLDKTFFPTTSKDIIKETDYIILTLGTPVDEHMNPDYRQIDKVMKCMNKYIRKGHTIILRSTIAPGTTESLKNTLEEASGLIVGKDIFLAFCPERIAQGKAIQELQEIPQIIGTLDENSKDKAKELFLSFNENLLFTDARSAELAKIFTNMYRYIDFAISNQFMMLAEDHGRDIHEITNLVNHKYKRGGLKSPGMTAGPCLYKDGFFLLNNMPFSDLISTSWKINENTPLFLLNQIKKHKDLKGKKVALLGMTFKANSDDTRNSLCFKMKKALESENADLHIHDPFVDRFNCDLKEVIKDAEIIIIGTNHDSYKNLDIKGSAHPEAIVCDIWNHLGNGKIITKLDEM